MIMLKRGSYYLLLVGILHVPCATGLSQNTGQQFLEPFRKVSDWNQRVQPTTQSDLYSRIQGIWNASWPAILKLKHESMAKNGFSKSYNISKSCVHDLLRFADGISEMEDWALHMLDASGKPASGLMLGNIQWIGMYGECLDVSSKQSDAKKRENGTVLGNYCLVNVGGSTSDSGPGTELGVCIPRTCNSSEAVVIVNLVLKNLTVEMQALSADCRDDSSPPLDSGAIVVITILCVVGTFLILGTCLDKISTTCKRNMAAVNGHAVDAKSEDDRDVSPLTNGSGPLEQSNYIIQRLDTNESLFRFLIAFSVLANAKKILSLELQQPNRNLDSLNGIRFFSMIWIILCHSYMFVIPTASNIFDFIDQFKRFTFQPLINGGVAVDTFFLLSGTLASYLLLLEVRARDGVRNINWPKFYFHRVWRLTPLYMMVLAIWATLYKHFGSGPYWPKESDEFCKPNWWTNLLYINNIVHRDEMCMSWSWYLSNDMQFFLLLPLFVALLYKWPLLGGIVTFVFMLTSSITTGVITYVNDYPPASPGALKNFTNEIDFMLNVYFVPWCRINPYLVGVLLGYVLYKSNFKLNIHRALVVVGWCFAAVCNLSVLYGLYEVSRGNYLSTSLNALYGSVHRFAWAVGVAWVILSCATGSGGLVNGLLSLKIFMPFSRLSYAAYLVHQMVILWYYNNRKVPIFVDDITMVYLFFGHLVLTYICAFAFSIMFEAPMINLERSFLRKRRNQD